MTLREIVVSGGSNFDLSYIVPVKSKVKISQNFLVFSELRTLKKRKKIAFRVLRFALHILYRIEPKKKKEKK